MNRIFSLTQIQAASVPATLDRLAPQKWSKSLILAALLVLFGSSGLSLAGIIPVTNFSFESPAIDDATATSAAPIPGWTLNSAALGTFNPQDAQYAGTTGSPGTLPSPGDGAQVLYINEGSAVSDHSLATIQADDTYTLTVALGNRLDTPHADGGTYLLELLANDNTILASKSGVDVPTPGAFADYSLSVTTPIDAAHDTNHVLGDGLTVFLQWTAPGQISFDNVRLSDSPVPEPSTLVLIAVALTCLATRKSSRLLIEAQRRGIQAARRLLQCALWNQRQKAARQ